MNDFKAEYVTQIPELIIVVNYEFHSSNLKVIDMQ